MVIKLYGVRGFGYRYCFPNGYLFLLLSSTYYTMQKNNTTTLLQLNRFSPPLITTYAPKTEKHDWSPSRQLPNPVNFSQPIMARPDYWHVH